MELIEDLEPLPEDSHGDRPLTLGPRPQVPRAQAGRLRARASRPGATHAAQRRHARAGRDRRGLQHLRQPDPDRDPGQPDRVRRRAARAAAATSTPRSATCGRWSSASLPVMRNLASPETDLAGFVRGLSAAAAEVAPVAEQQGQLFVALDSTFGAFADVARPFIQETISRSPGDGGRRDPDAAARSGRSSANTAGLFADLQPGFAALRPPAGPARATRPRSGSRPCAPRRPSTPSSTPPPSPCSTSPTTTPTRARASTT